MTNRTVNFLPSPIPPIVVKSCLHPVTPSVALPYQEAVRKIHGVKPCETGNSSGQRGAGGEQNPEGMCPPGKQLSSCIPALSCQQHRWTQAQCSSPEPLSQPPQAALGAVTQSILMKPGSENTHAVMPGLGEMRHPGC